jgi:hypothetical protein
MTGRGPLHALDQPEVFPQRIRLEMGQAASPVAGVERALLRILAGQQAFRKRPVSEHADSAMAAPRKQFRFRGTFEQVVAKFDRRDFGQCVRPLDVGEREVRKADRAHLARVLQICYRFQRLLERYIAVRRVEEIQRDRFDVETAQRILDRPAEVGGTEIESCLCAPLAGRQLPSDPALRHDEHLVTPRAQRFRKRPFGLAEAVDVRRIEDVDAELDGPLHRADRLAEVVTTPVGAAELLAADGNARHGRVRPREENVMH